MFFGRCGNLGNPPSRPPVRDVFYVGMLRETTGGRQFSHAGSCVLPIDSERALRTAGVLIIFVADLD